MYSRCSILPLTAVPFAALAWSAVSHAQAASPQEAAPAESAAPAAGPPATPASPPPAAAPADPAATPPGTFVAGDWRFALHGIAGASFYVQDTPDFVFNGQGPLLVLAKPTDGSLTTGADVRESRFNFSVAGPKVFGGATPKAVLEIDLFGLNSPGGYGEVSVYARTRLAYAELDWGNDVLRFGQDHELILALIPESMGHMAFPVTYWNGMLGWREPGAGYFHTIPMDDSKLELAVQVIKSDWANPADFGDATTSDLNVDYGQLSGYPGVEARAKWTTKHFMAFAAGHFNHVMGTHAGDLVIAPMATPTRNWDVYAGVAGFKIGLAGFTLAGSAYYGQNTAPLLGEQLNFIESTDVHEWGAWGQLGYDIVKGLNVSVLGGTAQPNKSDVQKAAPATGGERASSSVFGGMIRYREGGFAIGPEFYHVIANQIDSTGTSKEIDVNQFMLSGMYFF